jgi:large subunit ribosomal protein L15
MSQILSRLAPAPGTKRAHKRKGRGPGSGLGKTAGKGQKGQKARHPGDFGKVHFQGGQTPMQRRLPKIGFNVPFPITTIGVNVEALERFDAGSNVDEAALRKARLVQGRQVRVKILGEGELTKKLTVTAHGFSKTATAKIEKAGGKCVVVPEPRAPKTEVAAS